MPEILKACPLCHFDKYNPFEIRQFRGSKVENKICLQCGFVFQSPRMTAEELDNFYTRSYREVYQGQEEPTEKDLSIQRKRARHLLRYIKNLIPQVVSHLDIGSSAGILLEYFQEFFRCRSVGVEPGDAYRGFTDKKGLEVYVDLDRVHKENQESFDLISMIHILEHIPDPILYLTEIRESFINPDGYLLVEVPNLYFHDSLEIAHMSAFSQHSLKETLIQSGFSIIAKKAHGYPRSKLLPIYLTVLAKPIKDKSNYDILPEKWVRQKRDLGLFYRRIAQKLFPTLSWVPYNFEW